VDGDALGPFHRPRCLHGDVIASGLPRVKVKRRRRSCLATWAVDIEFSAHEFDIAAPFSANPGSMSDNDG
jgi:hypothetical protein